MSELKELQFIDNFRQGVTEDEFVELRLNNYKGEEGELKKIRISPVIIRGENKLRWVFQYNTRDITKNYSLKQSVAILNDYLGPNGFWQSTLYLQTNDLVLEYRDANKSFIRKLPASKSGRVNLEHNRKKKRYIEESEEFLIHLGISSTNGKVYQKSEKKYKQVNHYIDSLFPILTTLKNDKENYILDMGSGKGYLTFALYKVLNDQLKKNTRIVGVELRDNLVKLCNEVAEKSNFRQLTFEKGTIQNYKITRQPDALIALHACDTATDEAIYQGIKNKAQFIVVAPCCHKQIRKEMSTNSWNNHPMLQFGVFMERYAEMITDTIRTMLLQIHGYKTKVIQFVSDHHTPKNVMIIAEKSNHPINKSALQDHLENIKVENKIGRHYLEFLLKDCP